MAKTIWDYKVSFPYGATSAPYSKSNPHKGEDRAAPAGTPITVNGVQIGLVGTTGYSTGNHCHIGKWSGGSHKAPNGGGKSFKSAVVTQVAQDAVNGKYVRVQADGYSWVYLHMSKQTCKVGQKLVAPKPAAKVYTTVKSGEGLSQIAKRAGYKDWWLPTAWQRISNLNNGGLWTSFNKKLKPGQKIRIK